EYSGRPLIVVLWKHPPTDGLKRLGAANVRIEGSGARVLAISRQSVADNAKLHAARGLPFPLLSDRQGTAWSALGCAADTRRIAVLDANQRLAALLPESDAGLAAAIAWLESEAPRRRERMLTNHPPVLVIPRVLSESDCRNLIAAWHKLHDNALAHPEIATAIASSQKFIREYGKVFQYTIDDPALTARLDAKLAPRIGQELHKGFQTIAPQREDWRLACYDIADSGHLPPHRDNVNTHTTHRRFTVSITLNGGAFVGGNLVFAEYSDHAYDVETGSAVIFSASVLHEVTPVTSGRRMALLTHLFGQPPTVTR
ncbi:MAG: 2OG-Fe(II) oxygenase, partial [Pseudomonadota bacterium]